MMAVEAVRVQFQLFLRGIARIESPLLGDLMLQPSRNSLKSRLIEEIGWSYQKSWL